MLVVPVPSLGVDRFADAAKDAETREIVWLHVVCTETAKETDGGGGGVELGEFVLFDGLPVARGRGVDRSRFKDGGGDAVGEGTVDDVAEWFGIIRMGICLENVGWNIRVSGDPADVSHASEAVVGVDIENVLERERSREEVASGGVHDSFGLSGRSRCLFSKVSG